MCERSVVRAASPPAEEAIAITSANMVAELTSASATSESAWAARPRGVGVSELCHELLISHFGTLRLRVPEPFGRPVGERHINQSETNTKVVREAFS
jgi:hypothetical protein